MQQTSPQDFPKRVRLEELPKKVVFCIPTLTRPYQVTLDSLAASIPLIVEAGWQEGTVYEIGCPYISAARSMMLRKALDAKATVVVFIDHDVSWEPGDLLRLIEAEGDVVAGTYRYKDDAERYMGAVFSGPGGKPIVRDEDGAIKMHSIPAGFLKITRQGVNKFITAYPELTYGEPCAPHIDLFQHGAHDGVWWGEDYAFARRWREKCGDVWLLPDLNIAHNTPDKAYPGNFHEFLLRCPGGSKWSAECPTG